MSQTTPDMPNWASNPVSVDDELEMMVICGGYDKAFEEKLAAVNTPEAREERLGMLEMFIGEVPLGRSTIGFEAKAAEYFGGQA